MPGPKGFGGDDLPDPQEMLRKLRSNIRYIIFGVIGLIVVVGVYQSVYTVEIDEEALVLRLGRHTGEQIGPGLHFRIPIVDQVYKAQTRKIRQLEFGFQTKKADVKSQVDETARDEGLMLTGNLELVNVQWTVLYRITDLYDYYFKVRDVEETIRDISEASVRLIVGDLTSDQVMILMRETVALEAQEKIQKALDQCNSGIMVESVALRQVEPPKEAQEAFNKVNEARARMRQTIEKARRDREARVSPMEGRKDAIVSLAAGRAGRQKLEAQGEAARFEQTLAAYKKDPATTRQWLYLQTMLRVWQNVGKKFVLDQGGSTLQILPLGQLDLGAAAASAPTSVLPARAPSSQGSSMGGVR